MLFSEVLAISAFPSRKCSRVSGTASTKKCSLYEENGFAVPVRRAYTERMKINVTDWIESYTQTCKLPELRIPCISEDCDVTTTCFGSNLEGRIKKTEGGLRALLTTFKCRSCRGGASAKTVRMTMKDGVPLKRAAKAVRKGTKKAAKEEHIEQLKQALRSATMSVNAVPQRVSFNDPEAVRQLTEGACQRPDIYLDNDRACDGCGLYEHCACKSKQLLAHTGRKKLVAGPKRKK